MSQLYFCLKFSFVLSCVWHVVHVVAYDLNDINIPTGFSISEYATNLPGARSLALSTSTEANIVYISTRTLTNIYVVLDRDFDNSVDAQHTLLDNLSTPNGIAYRSGSLFVAQINRVLRYDDIDSYALAGTQPTSYSLVSSAFPSDASHGWKYIAFGPDDKLYVPVGAPCNVCPSQDYGSIAYSTINRMDVDGSNLETFATGIRNTVGFDWHPVSGELYFTDNGRDRMGDNLPDCELNRVQEAGVFFGFPYCHTQGTGLPESRDVGVGTPLNDPDYNSAGSTLDCSAANSHTRALQALGPHTAPLGMKFYPQGGSFPEEYHNAVFIAEHGSWNRAQKIGYRVSVVKLNEDGTAKSRETFADGWLQGQTTFGRPVDVLVMPDGALLVSDDYRGVIYRIQYDGTHSLSPSQHPTPNPTQHPTSNPTTQHPTSNPTPYPTSNPTQYPTFLPTQKPAPDPTLSPSSSPMQSPSFNPTLAYSLSPTASDVFSPPGLYEPPLSSTPTFLTPAPTVAPSVNDEHSTPPTVDAGSVNVTSVVGNTGVSTFAGATLTFMLLLLINLTIYVVDQNAH